MPKINVYLPDDLAEAVRRAGVPVSKVCQRALEGAVREAKSVTITPTFERFTDRAKFAVMQASRFAESDGVDLGSEHVLRGLLAEPDGVAHRALVQLGISDERIVSSTDKRSSTADGNAAYLRALQEALKLGHNYIGTEHLLLALGESNSTAREVLSELGVTSSALRSTVISILTSVGVPAPYKPPDVSAKLDEVLRRLEQLEKRLPN